MSGWRLLIFAIPIVEDGELARVKRLDDAMQEGAWNASISGNPPKRRAATMLVFIIFIYDIGTVGEVLVFVCCGTGNERR